MKLFGSMENVNGVLHIGGVSVNSLVNTYGSPLYVIDRVHVENIIDTMKNSFKSDKFATEIAYASKAFINKAMVQFINTKGLSLDVVSDGELYTAKVANFPSEKIYMHGNNKTDEELRMAIEYNVGTIVVDSKEEFFKLSKIAEIANKVVNVILRVNPGIDAHTHEYIQTSKFDSKFGESIFDDSVITLIKDMINHDYINFLGFHCHIGSQIFDEKPFYAEAEVMLDFIKKIEDTLNYKIKILNLGGGFGIYYSGEDDPIDLDIFLKKIIEILENKLEEKKLSIEKVVIEPGRSIIANSGVTLYKVGSTKTTYSGKKYIFVDGGMTDNIRPALYQAEYEGVIANRLNDTSCDTYTVAGKCCESGDILIKNKNFVTPNINDILAVFSTGAYNYSMASNYNRLKKPAVIMVKDKKVNLIVKRETYEDLIRNDLDFEE
ncbi:MAG: diaminopimelate decarboxylase [Fusobacteriaceae bacterium]|nr:diaminopimelate decarboxylase [Fusobacteriaceae bacterium]